MQQLVHRHEASVLMIQACLKRWAQRFGEAREQLGVLQVGTNVHPGWRRQLHHGEDKVEDSDGVRPVRGCTGKPHKLPTVTRVAARILA